MSQYSTHQESFDRHLVLVDRLLWELWGIPSHNDLADRNWKDEWEDGATPRSAVKMFCAEEPMLRWP